MYDAVATDELDTGICLGRSDIATEHLTSKNFPQLAQEHRRDDKFEGSSSELQQSNDPQDASLGTLSITPGVGSVS